MSYTLLVQSEAIIDMQEAFEWYEEQRAGLGVEFIEELEQGLRNSAKIPNIIRLSIRPIGG